MSSEPARPTAGSIAFVLDGSTVDAGLIGGKGAALDELLSWGLPVPPSGSVTTAAHRIVMADPRVRAIVTRIREGTDTPAEAVDEAFLSVELDEAVAAAVVSVAAAVGAGAKIAVRSSATVEDLAGSSFAGQYQTFLDVDPSDGDAVLDAVRLVLASLWHPAPCVYRRALGVDDEDAAMSVLFVQMVPAVTAGVVFTVDPLGGRGAARVEAVEGLGESLVSGRRTPRAWTVDRDAPGDDVPQPIREALRLALSAEEHAHAPQDVEWVWDGSQVWLVQSRPITVAPSSGDGFDDELEDEDMTVAGIAEMLPGVLPPLRWEVDAHLVEEAFRCMSEDLGVATPSGERGRHMLRRVRGRAALDFGRLRMVAAAIPGAGADELEKQYFGSRRSGRPATEPPSASTRFARLRHGLRVIGATRRNTIDADTVAAAVDDLASDPMELGSRSDRELMAYRLALIDLGVRAMGAELGVAAVAAAAHRRVELLLLPHLGAEEAGREAAVVAAVRGIAVTAEPEASAAVFGGPTWLELGRQPPVLPDSPGSEADPLDELQRRVQEVAPGGLESLRGALRARTLTKAVHDAREQMGRRERTKAAVLRLGGEVRRVHMELGQRLVERAVLDDAADVELLTTAELVTSLRGKGPGAGVLGRRRRWRIQYESESPLPIRFRGPPTSAEVELPSGGRLEGWAASPGRFTGTAQVVSDPDAPFEGGRVLVAEATDASWSPLFVKAGAVVLERGGPLSHAAILARELGVPAVLNVPGVTVDTDGVELTVDGDVGVVVRHDTGEDAGGDDDAAVPDPGSDQNRDPA